MTQKTPVTIKDLKKFLEQFPEDTLVEFAFQKDSPRWESFGKVEFESPVLEKEEEWSTSGPGWEFLDFRGNQFIKPDSDSFGKTFLLLGEKC